MLSSGTFPSRTRAQIEDRAINQLITGTSFSAPRQRVNSCLAALLSLAAAGAAEGCAGCWHAAFQLVAPALCPPLSSSFPVSPPPFSLVTSP